ncbi:MAG: hypothetical protein ACKN9T_13920 [Candidatus Methylumidiphilus sp.]
MSKIFELFGYRLDAWNADAAANCAKAWCPFMDVICDGGGNRYLSAIDLHHHPELAAKFPGKRIVQAGVCSLQMREHEQPWIVCPRRLLSLREQRSGIDYQQYVKAQLAAHMELSCGKHYRAWAEVKMKIDTSTEDDQEKSFDYTFDYVIADARKIQLSEAAKIIGRSERVTQRLAEKNGFTLSKRGDIWIEDFPADPVVIVEIMTSSTSGGDKAKRTQIGMAFEDAVLNLSNHNGPGINYRQVWARMVSQLIVKSQVGIAWNGKTIWLIQDVLAEYISSTTALNLSKYLSECADEVNILAFGYGDIDNLPTDEGVLPLRKSSFYAGPINKSPSVNADGGGFVDIVKIGAPPPKDQLWRSLFLKSACANFSV